MKKKILIIIFTAVIGGIITMIGNYELQQIYQKTAKPILLKSVVRTDLTGLPPEVQARIPLVPITYNLQHQGAGLPALEVTISIRGEQPLSIADLQFSPDSEAHEVVTADPHTIKVNVPEIRPDGLVHFQLMTSPASRIEFSELSDNAKIIDSKDASQNGPSATVIKILITVIVVGLWGGIIGSACTLLWKMGNWWYKMDTGEAQPNLKRRLITVLVLILIYNMVVWSLGPLSAWLPLPHISTEDFAGAFLLYLLITRYKLLERWIQSAINLKEARVSQGIETLPVAPIPVTNLPAKEASCGNGHLTSQTQETMLQSLHVAK
jgi:hypothetical protein